MTEDLRLERHPRFRRMHDYLAAKAPPGSLPGRQHIEPTEIPDLLPYLMLIEVVPEASGETRFRVRLAGTWVVLQFGSEVTGRFLDEILAGAAASAIIEKCRHAVATGRPNYHHATVAAPNRDHVAYERVVFPLARDGEHVDMLAAVFALKSDPPAPPRGG